MYDLYKIMNEIDDEASLNITSKSTTLKEGIFDSKKEGKYQELLGKVLPEADNLTNAPVYIHNLVNELFVSAVQHVEALAKKNAAKEEGHVELFQFMTNINKALANKNLLTALRYIIDFVASVDEKAKTKELEKVYDVLLQLNQSKEGKDLVNYLSKHTMKTLPKAITDARTFFDL